MHKIKTYKVPQAGHSAERDKYIDLRHKDMLRVAKAEFKRQGLKWGGK